MTLYVNLFQAPLWAYILGALGLFIYQSLDAIDGKQARRTNSSSPLGELFDHGCDSISTGSLNLLLPILVLKKLPVFKRSWLSTDLLKLERTSRDHLVQPAAQSRVSMFLSFRTSPSPGHCSQDCPWPLHPWPVSGRIFQKYLWHMLGNMCSAHTLHLHVQCSLNDLMVNKEFRNSMLRDSLLYIACVFQWGAGHCLIKDFKDLKDQCWHGKPRIPL